MRERRMGKFKVGDRVIPSKLMLEKCEVSEWLERVKDKVEDDGYLVISQIYGTGTYLMKGLPSVIFDEEWLEPYSENIPKVLSTSIYDYNLLLPLPEDRLSVRDRFAMAALMCYRADLFTAPEYVAEKAYKVADAMMEARKI